MKQKKIVMCHGATHGSNNLTLIGISFDSILCFIRTQHPNQWEVRLKNGVSIEGYDKFTVAASQYNDHVGDDTIEEMCMLTDED